MPGSGARDETEAARRVGTMSTRGASEGRQCDANENLHAEERPAPSAYIFLARVLYSVVVTVASTAEPSYCLPLAREGTG